MLFGQVSSCQPFTSELTYISGSDITIMRWLNDI